MYVRDWMTERVVTVTETERVAAARALMAARRIRHLPVVRDGRLVGLVSERDLRGGGDAGHDGLAGPWARTAGTVGAHTHGRPVTVAPGDDMAWAAGRMYVHRIGALPVVVDGARLVGILTSTDVLRFVSEVLGFGQRTDREVLSLGPESPPLWEQLRDRHCPGQSLTALVLFRLPGRPPEVLACTASDGAGGGG